MIKGISSDLEYGLKYNYDDLSFLLDDIVSVEAEIPGENDSKHWFWILKIKGKGYLLLDGWCDYTGWDCGSGIEELGYFKTKLQAAKAAPIKEEYYDREIREPLIKQVKTGSSFEPEVREY